MSRLDGVVAKHAVAPGQRDRPRADMRFLKG